MIGKLMSFTAFAGCLVAVRSSNSGCYQSYQPCSELQTYGQDELIAPFISGCSVFDKPNKPIYQSAPVYSTIPIASDNVREPAPLEYLAEQPYNNIPQNVVSQRIHAQNCDAYISGPINCDLAPHPEDITYLKPLVLPDIIEPIRDLPAPPLPKSIVISTKCSCTKVVKKPQLYQRLIHTQRNQRFLKKTYVPRVEKIAYSAKPRC